MNNTYKSKACEGTTPRFIPESRFIYHDHQMNPYSINTAEPNDIEDSLPDPTKVDNR